MPDVTNHIWGDDWAQVRSHWPLDFSIAQLNHGSFGATPSSVLAAQQEWRNRIEREPVNFFQRELPVVIRNAREQCARFLNADIDGFVFVPNATTAINSVARSVTIDVGDEILISDHVYPAVYHTMRRLCAERGATLVMQSVPIPTETHENATQLADAFLAGLTDRTRLAIIDHIASPTGLIFPVKRIVDACREQGTLCLVDAAHAPGQLPTDLNDLDPDFWTGNFHKWVCAPKVSGGFYVRKEFRAHMRSAVTSNYADQGFDREFLWVGTHDPSPYLATPDAIEFMSKLGWDRVRSHNNALARFGRSVISRAIGTDPPIPDSAELFASLALVALPDSINVGKTDLEVEAFRASFYKRTGIETTFITWNTRPFIRLSAQVYNAPDEYERLAHALVELID
jgi:isopenicillin-N epimerase